MNAQIPADTPGNPDIPAEHDYQFIGRPLTPLQGSFDVGGLARGEPGLPAAFRSGRDTLTIAKVIRRWRETGPCSHGSGERYTRKHWFEVETPDGRRARLYFERKARPGQSKVRWHCYSATEPPPPV
ncbi:MAG: cytoplasmic protein [Puniceicoccaceae bacterium]|nr:MAG: cytoplasmic protein [Puniceicoccaceae bacterium]